jgi:hypothetical protein
MAIGGRKPLPAENKQTRGNPGGRAIPETPRFSPGDNLAPPERWPISDPEKPETVGKDYERQEWGRIVGELVLAGIAKSVHQGGLEMICQLYAMMNRAADDKKPADFRLAAAEYRKAQNEYGLTPASAGRVGFIGGQGKGKGKGKDADEDPAAEFDGPRLVKPA